MSGSNTSTSSLYSNSYQYQNSVDAESYGSASKALQTKALGSSAGADSQGLRSWMEQAYDYYNAVMSGAEAQPNPAAWQEFLGQMDWASKQLGDSNAMSFDDSMETPDQAGSAATLGPDPFGGMPGTMNNYVYTEEDAHIGFVGNGVRDIWSNDVTIDVAPVSAQVTTEATQDTRTQPPEDVIKITVKDPATGTEATYFIHNYLDANIKINTPSREAQVTNGTPTYVEVGKFRKDEGTASDEVNVPFEEQDDGTRLVEVPYGESIQFKPVGDGEDQNWDVYGNFDISLKPSDQVQVNKVADPESGYEIVVTHKDGSKDTFKIHKDFQGNINGYPENIQWGDPASGGSVGEDIPSDFSGDITLNSSGKTSESDKPSTQADHVSGDTATYNTANQVEIYADYDDHVTTHEITTPGEVTLHGTSYADTVVVTKRSDGKYEIKVYQDGETGADAKVETYIVDGASKISLDFMPEKISGDAASDPIIQKGIGSQAETSNDGARAVADQLSQLSGFSMSADEILAKGQEMGINLEILPAIPTSQLMGFLVAIDPKLAQMIHDLDNASGQDAKDAITTQIRNRLVELLTILYPTAGVQAAPGNKRSYDNIFFNGVEYDVVSKSSANNYFNFFKQSATNDD